MGLPSTIPDGDESDPAAGGELSEDAAHALFLRAIEQVTGDALAGAARPEQRDDDVVLLIQRSTSLSIDFGDPGGSAHELARLDDGSVLVRTTWTMTVRDELAVVLAEWHDDWIAEHGDARGVPSFPASHLEHARAGRSYEGVLERLGELVAFLVPRTLREVGVGTSVAAELIAPFLPPRA